jgi:hypothetical protein
MDRRLFFMVTILCLTLGFGAGCANNRFGCLGRSCGGGSCDGGGCGPSAATYPYATPADSYTTPSYSSAPVNTAPNTFNSQPAPSGNSFSGSGSR